MIISPSSLDTNLSQLLDEVNTGKTQLPEFQRDWTWDDGRICGIIASLSQGYEMSAVEIGNEVDRHHLAITKIMEKLLKRDYVSFVTRDKRYYSIKEKAISIFFNDVMETVENENS